MELPVKMVGVDLMEASMIALWKCPMPNTPSMNFLDIKERNREIDVSDVKVKP